MDKSTRNILIGVAIVVILGGAYWWYTSSTKKGSIKEPFTALSAGANSNTGMLLDDSYDLLHGEDNMVPSPHFADLVAQGDHTQGYIAQPRDIGENLRPMERLQRIQGKSLMPRVSTHVTPFNVDVANPTSHKYMVNTPRVETALKSKYKDYSQASFIRGDIAITCNPNVPLISKSHLGRDDLRLDGLFTPYFSALYNKYTGKEHKNLPFHVAGAGVASGSGGATGGTIMDSY